MPAFRLRDLPRDAKVLVTAFLVTLTLGYATGIGFVYLTTAMTPRGIAGHYAGSDDAGEMKFEKSPLELAQTTHNHVLSLSLLFGVLCALLLGVEISSARRRILLVESFAAIITSFGSLWLIRYVSPHFSWILLASGIGMAATYFAIVALVLRELWWRASRPT